MSKSVFAVLLLFLLFSCGGKEERVRPVKTDISEYVYSSATIQPDSLYQVFAVVNGILEKNLVEEGDLVQKGHPLIQVNNSSPLLNAENARYSLELARENLYGRGTVLRSIEAEINSAKLKLKNDSINFFRQKRLWDRQIGSRAEYDARELSYEISSNTLERLQTEYDQTRQELETRLRQAENNYKNALINTSDFTLASKINGKVYALHKKEGEVVNATQPLATVGSATTFLIEMLVDEVDIVKVKTGQLVLLTLDSYKNKVFTARVKKIYPKKDERNQTFTIEALFDEAPEVLYPGLSGEANIQIAYRKDALTIPRNYLLKPGTVITQEGQKEITTGIESIDRVEVTSGVTEGTWIYKPKND